MFDLFGFFKALFNLFGYLRTPVHDVIVVGGGAAGCPLAQTLSEGGLKVLLLERGQEPPESSRSLYSFVSSIRGSCSDPIVAETGHVMVAGNCLGGASTFNGGAWVEETAEWVRTTILQHEPSFFDTTAIEDAYAWVRQRMSPEASSEPEGSYLQTFSTNLGKAFAERDDFEYATTRLSGQPDAPTAGVFRTHSLFASDGTRRSADLILDRTSPNLDVITGARVSRLAYQGDWLDTPMTMNDPATSPPTARCVRLETFELHCVKPGGRIYITAGTLYTPVILMNSGIGEGGRQVDNPAVGKNLSDKHSAKLTANLKEGLDFGGGGSFGNIAATQVLHDRTIIYEQSSVDLDDALWDLSSYEQSLFPLHLRGSFLAKLIYEVGDSCNKQVSDDANFFGLRNPMCGGQFSLNEANCDQNIFGLSVFTSPPRSVGSVSRTLFGQPKIDINFFENDDDLEALGIMLRTTYEVLGSLNVAELPCAEEEGDSCERCPDLVTKSSQIIQLAHSILNPFDAFKFPSYPNSRFFSNAVEALLLSTPDNVEVGRALQNTVNSGQHFVGTAAMGTVVDHTFKVKGATGVYVADAAVLPRTSRGNVMATVMMLARLAGVSGVEEMTSSTTET